MKFKVYPRFEDYAQRLSIYILAEEATGRVYFVKSIPSDGALELEEYEPGRRLDEPTICIDGPIAKPFMRAMATALDDFGIRPEGKPVAENELSAVRDHLQDMRALVFARAGVDKP